MNVQAADVAPGAFVRAPSPSLLLRRQGDGLGGVNAWRPGGQPSRQAGRFVRSPQATAIGPMSMARPRAGIAWHAGCGALVPQRTERGGRLREQRPGDADGRACN